MLDSEKAPYCMGCGTHIQCIEQRHAIELLHQIYGAVRHDVGIAEALADIEGWLD